MTKDTVCLKDIWNVMLFVILTTAGPALIAKLRDTSIEDTALPLGIGTGALEMGATLYHKATFFKNKKPCIKHLTFGDDLKVCLWFLFLFEVIGFITKQLANALSYSSGETDMDLVKNVAYSIPISYLLVRKGLDYLYLWDDNEESDQHENPSFK